MNATQSIYNITTTNLPGYYTSSLTRSLPFLKSILYPFDSHIVSLVVLASRFELSAALELLDLFKWNYKPPRDYFEAFDSNENWYDDRGDNDCED